MSEIGLNINVDSYNNEGIKTIKGNNNAEIYKLYILKNKRRLSLVGKTVKLGYVMAGTTNGDIIENLNITNAEQGEITFPITNRISKKDGVYSCQLAIYGADEFLEYAATFGLTVEDNIFTKIAGEIENSKDLTYIERILDEAKTASGDLKTNIPVATNLNRSLESNISNARNINTTLADTTEKSKVAATDAIEKKSQLEKSITKAKEFIDGLDGSQNIPGIRMELTELQNGLKSNQALAYQGNSINAENTLEGRTEGMKIKGRTLNNLYKPNNTRDDTGKYILVDTLVKDEPKDRVVYIVNNTNRILLLNVYKINGGWDSNPIIRENSISKLDLTGKKLTGFLGMYDRGWTNSEADKELLRNTCIVLDREETYIPQKYFEGLKSFGEAEKEGDKYKISILSHGKNFFNINEFSEKINEKGELEFKADGNSRVANYMQIYTERNLNSKIIFNGYDSVGREFTTVNQEKYYIWVGLHGDKKDNKVWGEIILPKNTTCYYSAINEKGDNFVKFKDIQIEIGTSKTHYEPYKEDKKDILIKEPLRGFDENTCDVMYEDNGQVKINRKIGSYTFNGNEDSWHLQSINEHGIANFQMPIKNVRGRIALCNRLVQQSTLIAETTTEGFHISEDNAIYIRLKETTANNIEQFKTWLSNNHISIISDLIKSSTEDVENCIDIDLDTYQEKTYFNILNSIPGTLDFKVPSNIGSVVQNMAKEVNNIWDVINNLLVPSIVKANGNLAMLKLNNNLN
ncbi:BppU family phage baseplate upper protein [Clostridium perfringens]|nr:BppU family phage baseplate upper protein [Clostridium perfringens]